MLYMKTRVTFRISPDLADALRELPNQTTFVEDALRSALGRRCPVCAGLGRIAMRRLQVANVRDSGIERLTRAQAQELQQVFRLGQQVAATHIDLEARAGRVRFTMLRDGGNVLAGTLDQQEAN
jgi:hypothetical protein